MRDILFSAKRIDNGCWVSGYHIKDGVTGKHFIVAEGSLLHESDKVGEEGLLNFVAFEVDEDTISVNMDSEWTSVEERLPEAGRIVLITQTYSWENLEEGASVTIGRLSPEKNNKMWEFQYYRPDFRSGTIMDNDIICPGSEYVIAWRPLPEPYRPERSEE